MGAELGELYYLLWREVAWLNHKWFEMRALFASGTGRLELMDRTAPTFFADLERVLWLDLSLHMCRLTDPPETRPGQRNVSLQAMEPLLPAALQATYRELLAQVGQAVTFARGWRNKVFAHHDLATATERSPKPLEPANVRKVNEALRRIGDAMNFVEERFGVGPAVYDMQMGAVFGADCLLTYLDEGLAALECRPTSHPPRRSDYL